MTVLVTLHVQIEPYEDEYLDGSKFDGNKIVAEVKRGDDVLYTESILTNNSVISVCEVRDDLVDDIERWAIENTDYVSA